MLASKGKPYIFKWLLQKIIQILVSTTKFDFLRIMPKTVFYNLRNPFSTVFSFVVSIEFFPLGSMDTNNGYQLHNGEY